VRARVTRIAEQQQIVVVGEATYLAHELVVVVVVAGALGRELRCHELVVLVARLLRA
jgi:hypothetical protein